MDAAVERQLADEHEIPDFATLDCAGGRQHAERDRQVERGAGLPHVGGRQVHGHPLQRELEAAVPDGRPHAVAALAHAGIRQPDHRELRQPERHVHLDHDRDGLDPDDGGGAEAGEHVDFVRCKRRVGGEPAVSRAIPRNAEP